MAKFYFKRRTIIEVTPPKGVLIPDAKTGLPTIHQVPGRWEECKHGIKEVPDNDTELIERIRKDKKFGIVGTAEIREISKADDREMAIRTKADRKSVV